MIDKYKRYQKDFYMHDMFPIRTDKICACGCEKPLTGRRTRWASKECNGIAYANFSFIKGGNSAIRYNVHERDNGMCAVCGKVDPNWQADHIIPVHQGGGGCTIENFQTLCLIHHKEKTKEQAQMLRNPC